MLVLESRPTHHIGEDFERGRKVLGQRRGGERRMVDLRALVTLDAEIVERKR
jgi:hypothetical protein